MINIVHGPDPVEIDHRIRLAAGRTFKAEALAGRPIVVIEVTGERDGMKSSICLTLSEAIELREALKRADLEKYLCDA